jgi:hypothetical protein
MVGTFFSFRPFGMEWTLAILKQLCMPRCPWWMFFSIL